MIYLIKNSEKRSIKSKLLIIFTSLIFSCFCNAQIDFTDRVIIDEDVIASSAISMRVVDINNDGHLDVLSCGSGVIVWFDNVNGNGVFDSKLIRETVAYSVFAADIDGDNDLDVVAALDPVSATSSDRIVWYENLDGEGNFSSQQIITTSVIKPRCVYVSDIDNDGYLDVISASLNDGKIAWYKNLDGNGNFGTQNVVAISGAAKSISVNDIDNDNDMDIVFCTDTNSSNVSWIENLDGLGGYGPIQTIDTYSSDGFEQVVVSDVDGDNDMDVISVYSNNVVWYENQDGIGDFGFRNFISTNASQSQSVFATDLDGDNDIDILSTSSSDNKISWYENLNSQGQFGDQQNLSTNALSTGYISAGDIDGDGDNDIISPALSWYENINGEGLFSIEKAVSKFVNNPLFVSFADFNGDNSLDVLASSYNTITWFPNIDGQGDYSVQHFVTRSASISTKPIPIDMDGDSDIDILTYLDGAANKIVWYENLDGFGNFSTEHIIVDSFNQLNNLSNLILKDINNDNNLDILITIDDNGDILYYENIDNIVGFESPISLFNINTYDFYALASADIDSDGDNDIITGSNSTVMWLENLDGNGNLGVQSFVTSSGDIDGLEQIVSADLDGDSDLDILIASKDDDKISWYENEDGQGTFSDQKIISEDSNSAILVSAIDLDLDGNIDVIANNGSQIRWFKNLDGFGDFSEALHISDGYLYNGALVDISVADADNDGDVDFVTAGSFRDQIFWHENFLEELGNTINGSVNYDLLNEDCVSSNTIDNVMVITDNGIDSFATFVQSNGNYLLSVTEGDFTTSINSNLPSYFSVNPVSETSNFIGVGNLDYVDFCINTTVNVNDLNINVIPTSEARPGFDSSYRIVFTNIGTTQLNGSVSLSYDNTKMNFNSASQSITSQTENTIIFDYSNFNPFESRSIDLEFNIFSSVDIDEILLFNANILPLDNDSNQQDNNVNYGQTVIGSFDPNDITVLEGEEILFEDVDEYLNYVIRFQNTGTASAINVRINNVLDQKLDWTSMQLITTSHPCRVEITNGNNIDFIFDDINLPDSTSDENNSHGFIAYKIKPTNDIVISDIIFNNADIYFDFNEPIVTNTVSTEVVEDNLSVEDYSKPTFKLYPNPTNDLIEIISNHEIETIKVYNSLGQLVLLNNKSDFIDLTELGSGIYIIELKVKGHNVEVKKVIKQ